MSLLDRYGPQSTFDFPTRDLAVHLFNSFISTTMCDDLARATEARDGKKIAMSLLDVRLDCGVLFSSTSYSGFDLNLVQLMA